MYCVFLQTNWLPLQDSCLLASSAVNLAAAQLASIDVLYPDEVTSIADGAIMWGKEFSKLVNSAVAVRCEDMRKQNREHEMFDDGHFSPKSQKKGGNQHIIP